MSLTVQQPTSGTLQIQGAMIATPLPAGTTVAQPTGTLQIIGAVIMGSLDANGIFIQQLP